jgi:hypothetical protein
MNVKEITLPYDQKLYEAVGVIAHAATSNPHFFHQDHDGAAFASTEFQDAADDSFTMEVGCRDVSEMYPDGEIFIRVCDKHPAQFIKYIRDCERRKLKYRGGKR